MEFSYDELFHWTVKVSIVNENLLIKPDNCYATLKFVSKYRAKIKLIMFPKIKREVNDLLSLSLTPTLFYLLIFYFALKKGEKALKDKKLG